MFLKKERKNEGVGACLKAECLQLLTRHNFLFLPSSVSSIHVPQCCMVITMGFCFHSKWACETCIRMYSACLNIWVLKVNALGSKSELTPLAINNLNSFNHTKALNINKCIHLLELLNISIENDLRVHSGCF